MGCQGGSDLAGAELDHFLTARHPCRPPGGVDELLVRAPAVDQHVAHVDVEQASRGGGEPVRGGLATLPRQRAQVWFEG